MLVATQIQVVSVVGPVLLFPSGSIISISGSDFSGNSVPNCSIWFFKRKKTKQRWKVIVFTGC
jgi:hypothetical protein